MSEPLLNVMKIMLLAGLYLFFVRVLWSVFSELRDPRTVVRKNKKSARSAAPVANHAMQRAANTPATVGAGAAAASQTLPGPMGPPPAAKPPAEGRLDIVEPAHMVGSHRLGREITCGRADSNGIVIDDTYVSSVHARIFETNGVYFFEDLDSRNGSLLNGAPVVATTALVPGDWVQLGATVMEFS